MDITNSIVSFPPFLEDDITDCFSVKIGGTVFQVSMYFDRVGKESVLTQFNELLESGDLKSHI